MKDDDQIVQSSRFVHHRASTLIRCNAAFSAGYPAVNASWRAMLTFSNKTTSAHDKQHRLQTCLLALFRDTSSQLDNEGEILWLQPRVGMCKMLPCLNAKAERATGIVLWWRNLRRGAAEPSKNSCESF